MFEISTKVDYGLLILLELAKSEGYIALADVAERHTISPKYLSQVIIPLKQAGIVQSREGSKGGYCLGKAANQITLRMVVEAIDGPLQLTRCMSPNHTCPAQPQCGTKPIWSEVKESIYQLLDQRTLADTLSSNL